jgi:hypothetical protein
MAKIYIAAKTSRRKQMAEIGRSLEAAGHTITSSWIFAENVFCELQCCVRVADVDSLIAYLAEHNNINLPAIVEGAAAA